MTFWNLFGILNWNNFLAINQRLMRRVLSILGLINKRILFIDFLAVHIINLLGIIVSYKLSLIAIGLFSLMGGYWKNLSFLLNSTFARVLSRLLLLMVKLLSKLFKVLTLMNLLRRFSASVRGSIVAGKLLGRLILVISLNFIYQHAVLIFIYFLSLIKIFFWNINQITIWIILTAYSVTGRRVYLAVINCNVIVNSSRRSITNIGISLELLRLLNVNMSFLKLLCFSKLLAIIRLHGLQSIEIHWFLMLTRINIIIHYIFSCGWVAPYILDVLLVPSYVLVLSTFILENVIDSSIPFGSLVH